MQKRGIRLRHLQGPTEPMVQPTRNRQRSPSPLSRKKIFPRPPDQQRHPEPQPQPYQRKPQPLPAQRPPIVMMSPIMNQPLNNHNVSIANDGNEYESEVERLIDSLKKKSLELERKEETILRLNKEIEYLKQENAMYQQEIRTLKAQLDHEKSLHLASQRTQQLYEAQQKIPSLRNQPQPQLQNKNTKNNYDYRYQQQQSILSEKSPIVHVKISTSQLESNNKKFNNNNNNNNNYNYRQEDRSKEQDSILSDYLSPLMVLSSEPGPKVLPSQQQQGSYQGGSKSNYSSSRNQSNGVSRIVKGESRLTILNNNNNSMKNYNSMQPPTDSPFTRQTQNLRSQKPDKYWSEHMGHTNPNPIPSQPQSQYQFERQIPRWPTFESSAAHFNTQMDNNRQERGQQGYQQVGGQWRGNNNHNGNRELAIEDSKQFRFQDFDFSDLDNSMANSQF